MRIKRISVLAVAFLVAATAFFAATTRDGAAAPATAARATQVQTQSCTPSGYVKVTFAWAPSGAGVQWADISTQNNNFTSMWSNSGPLTKTQNALIWEKLRPNLTHYFRVNTWTSAGWSPSDTIKFKTLPCVSQTFTPAYNLQALPLSGTRVHFQWTRGVDNNWYCVDTARTTAELLSQQGTWRNHGCGTTANVLDRDAFSCGTTYQWRVWAVGVGRTGHSQVSTFQTPACPFTPPSKLTSSNVDTSSVKLSWSRGVNNTWFCLDLATSESDLLKLRGSWMNFACGTTATSLGLKDLTCDTQYFWRVFAVGTGARGHSVVKTFSTAECPPAIVEAPIESVEILTLESSPPQYLASIKVGLPNACAKAHDFDLVRSGKVIHIEVTNKVENKPCAEVYGTYELKINLGSDFESGVRYTVDVNGKRVRFTAQ